MKRMSGPVAVAVAFLGCVLSNSVFAADVVKEGTRLQSKDQLKEIFPDATRIEEYTYVPKQWGGISLMGLIGRLMGDRAHKEYEGIDTKRYLYRAFKESDVLGIGHGSTIDYQASPFDVFVFYDTQTKIKDVRLEKIPTDVVSKLTDGGYLKQFVDRETADFSVNLGRKGRVKDWGEFARAQKRPSEGSLRGYWEKIVRSVRFNAAFVEVAYFISQHPAESASKASSR
jgi:hypothetical protein